MDYVGKEHRKKPWITSGKSTGRSRGLRRERAPEEAVDYVGKEATQGDGLRDPEERL